MKDFSIPLVIQSSIFRLVFLSINKSNVKFQVKTIGFKYDTVTLQGYILSTLTRGSSTLNAN